MCHQREFLRTIIAVVMISFFAIPQSLLAQAETHVVSPADLQKEAVTTTQTREQNLEQVREFLSSPVAEKALRGAHMDPVQVKNAASSLSDQELAQLASRAQKAQKDFAAGALSTRDIALIILGVAVIILIVVVAS